MKTKFIDTERENGIIDKGFLEKNVALRHDWIAPDCPPTYLITTEDALNKERTCVSEYLNLCSENKNTCGARGIAGSS